jgi:hypothetical protein
VEPGWRIVTWASVRECSPKLPILCGPWLSLQRRLALFPLLPEAVELDHHGRPSFRVGGKIFATLWNEGRMNVMLDEGGIPTAVERGSKRRRNDS